MKQVYAYLKTHHGDNYRVFNVSEKYYDGTVFDDKVSHYRWPDHYPPPIHLLVRCCEEMLAFIKAKKDNVVVIHCNSGKGRAGTTCTSLLFFMGYFDNMFECAKLFGYRRFKDDKMGVSQPCQVRYIHYFQAICKGIVFAPQIKYLDRIIFSSAPNVDNDGCKPYYRIFRYRGLDQIFGLFSQKDWKKDTIKYYKSDQGEIQLPVPKDRKIRLFGNIMIDFKHQSTLSTPYLFRTTINTAFIPSSNCI